MTFFWSGCPEWMLTIVACSTERLGSSSRDGPCRRCKSGRRSQYLAAARGKASCADIDEHQKLAIGLAVKT
ncbi:MAG TPA: hypothetical protein VJ349_23320, partial [Stellaceae bacterium]|nr:hypothetical protein [Stellaceae bacterium]